MSAGVPLRLALEPSIPTRIPRQGGYFEHGFQLRLAGGAVVLRRDPLLRAYGAHVAVIAVPEDEDEDLQSGDFEPGRQVRLIRDEDGGCEDEIGVWDGEGLRRAGSLRDAAAAVVGAALDCGLDQRAIVLTEDRCADDDRRNGLDLVVFHPGFVELDLSAAARYERPVRRTRPRLVLEAGGSGELRWWDPSGAAGPMETGDLPMSAELRQALDELRDGYAELCEQAGERRGFERLEASLDRSLLDDRAAALWKRARGELGRSFAVGFLGAGMERPVWSPGELDDDDDGEEPWL
jgi:hypothetical protein